MDRLMDGAKSFFSNLYDFAKTKVESNGPEVSRAIHTTLNTIGKAASDDWKLLTSKETFSLNTLGHDLERFNDSLGELEERFHDSLGELEELRQFGLLPHHDMIADYDTLRGNVNQIDCTALTKIDDQEEYCCMFLNNRFDIFQDNVIFEMSDCEKDCAGIMQKLAHLNTVFPEHDNVQLRLNILMSYLAIIMILFGLITTNEQFREIFYKRYDFVYDYNVKNNNEQRVNISNLVVNTYYELYINNDIPDKTSLNKNKKIPILILLKNIDFDNGIIVVDVIFRNNKKVNGKNHIEIEVQYEDRQIKFSYLQFYVLRIIGIANAGQMLSIIDIPIRFYKFPFDTFDSIPYCRYNVNELQITSGCAQCECFSEASPCENHKRGYFESDSGDLVRTAETIDTKRFEEYIRYAISNVRFVGGVDNLDFSLEPLKMCIKIIKFIASKKLLSLKKDFNKWVQELIINEVYDYTKTDNNVFNAAPTKIQEFTDLIQKQITEIEIEDVEQLELKVLEDIDVAKFEIFEHLTTTLKELFLLVFDDKIRSMFPNESDVYSKILPYMVNAVGTKQQIDSEQVSMFKAYKLISQLQELLETKNKCNQLKTDTIQRLRNQLCKIPVIQQPKTELNGDFIDMTDWDKYNKILSNIEQYNPKIGKLAISVSEYYKDFQDVMKLLTNPTCDPVLKFKINELGLKETDINDRVADIVQNLKASSNAIKTITDSLNTKNINEFVLSNFSLLVKIKDHIELLELLNNNDEASQNLINLKQKIKGNLNVENLNDINALKPFIKTNIKLFVETLSFFHFGNVDFSELLKCNKPSNFVEMFYLKCIRLVDSDEMNGITEQDYEYDHIGQQLAIAKTGFLKKPISGGGIKTKKNKQKIKNNKTLLKRNKTIHLNKSIIKNSTKKTKC